MIAAIGKKKKSVRLLLPDVGVCRPGSGSPRGGAELQLGEISPNGCDLDLCGGTALAPWRARRPRAHAASDLTESFQPWGECQQSQTPLLLGRAAPCVHASKAACKKAERKSRALPHQRVREEARPDVAESASSDTLTSAGMDSSDIACAIR